MHLRRIRRYYYYYYKKKRKARIAYRVLAVLGLFLQFLVVIFLGVRPFLSDFARRLRRHEVQLARGFLLD